MFSSRKLERATYDSLAIRFIAANDHPDHDTIATFRRRFLKQIEAMFVQVLLLARELGMLKLSTVALDGTKIHANASRHSAEAKIAPMIACGRERHHPSWRERFAAAPPAEKLPETMTPLDIMRQSLATPEGKRLYAKRKQIPEPVFGIVKSAIGFRQFLLRGLDDVIGAWHLATTAFNIKRMFALAGN